MSDRTLMLLFSAIRATTEVGAESLVYDTAGPDFPFGCQTHPSLPRQVAAFLGATLCCGR